VGSDEAQLDEDGRRVFRPIRHVWRVEVAHGRIGTAEDALDRCLYLTFDTPTI